MKYLMGIDNGGTFSKAALFDEDGKQISVASVPTGDDHAEARLYRKGYG